LPKVLSQSGKSLADIYDVEGSIAGVERLETKDVPLMHEMGQTIFSERVRSTILRLPLAVAANQSANFQAFLSSAGAEIPRRIMSAYILVADGEEDRVSLLTVVVSTFTGVAGVSREVPILVWDSVAGDDTRLVRMSENGGAVANFQLFVSGSLKPRDIMPTMLVDLPNDPSAVDRIGFRGSTLAFGAGTVTPILLVQTIAADSDQGTGVSSRGLPLPSW